MRKYLLIVLVTLFTCGAAMSQSALNSGDGMVQTNLGAAYGSVNKPDTVVPYGKIVKWVRNRNTGRIDWNADRFKAYYIGDNNGPGGANQNRRAPFRLRFPNSYDSTRAQKYPIMIFFHGGGEAQYLWENEDQLFWGAEIFQSQINSGILPNAFLLFIQTSTFYKDWKPDLLVTARMVLDSIIANKNGDPDRIIAMGLSDGGAGCADFTQAFPKYVAASLPSCPVHTSAAPADLLDYIHVPVWVGNGGTDLNPKPQDIHDQYYTNFHELGGNIYQSYYPNLGHVMWENMWSQRDNDNGWIIADYWNNAHKAQPLVFFDRRAYCEGAAISSKMGITAGFFAYQWQKNTTGSFVDIPAPAGTANEYTATEVGQYRVRFQRVNGGPWSDWTPNPVLIYYKPCSIDTVFKEDFEFDKDYLGQGSAAPYKKASWDCQNGIYLTGVYGGHSTDATGILGRRFALNHTYSAGGCNYTTTDNIWGMFQNQVSVTPGLRYVFSFSLANITNSQSNPPQITPRMNGSDLIAGSVAPPTNVNNFTSWRRFNFIWTNPNNQSFADMAIKNKVASTNGNEFLIDEISLTRLYAPGGVYANALWVKASSIAGPDGFGMSSWPNVAGNTDLQQTNFSSVPNLKNNATDNINFNPVAQFAAARNIGVQSSGNFAGTTTHSRAHIFMVSEFASATQVTDVITERESSTNRMLVNLNAPSGGEQFGRISWRTGSSTLNLQAVNVVEANKPALWSFSKDNVNTASGNKMDIRKNGIVVASNATTGTYDLNNGPFTLGNFSGTVAEMIYFIDENITPLRQNTIESYLAIKYGLTLGSPAAPQNYLASDSATNFWPGLANINYTQFQNDVFGIGTDIVGGLRMFRSNSATTAAGDGLGQTQKGNMVLSTNTALADKRFLMIGNDAATLSEQVITAGTAPALIENGARTGREWKVKNTGGVGAVNISFDTTGFTYTGGNVLSNFKLMIDGDGNGNFANGTVTFFNATSATGNRINFNGVTLADGVVFTVVVKTPAGSLPATWLGFTAEESNGNALLNWKTSEEINVASYAVEHSTTGSNFKEIGRVSARNTTAVNNYSYTDPSLAAGVHYYRIRRVDLDGKFNYSIVKTIKVSAVNAIQIRPNPVTGGNLVLAISVQRNEKATIQIVGVDGKVMSRRNTELVQGANNITLDVSNVPTGVYLVQVQLNEEVASKKFIKVR